MARLALFTILFFPIWWAQAEEIPRSDRSVQAIAAVQNQLKADFATGGLSWGSPAFIRIFKEEEVLEIWVKKKKTYRHFRTYQICRYSGDLGPKLQEGDGQSPEGFYSVSPAGLNPHSRYHLSFNIGFPNQYDQQKGRTGSYLMVHGDCVSAGCYAMAKRLIPLGSDRNQPIEEIWTLITAAFQAGHPTIPVHAFPFRLTRSNLEKHRNSEWIDFWNELLPGYQHFESTRTIPDIKTAAGQYVFN
ncbi:MAG: murein L,D-transpeptidase family protein [Sneathiella sp.]